MWSDLRLAVRLLLRDRTFTLTALGALVLGIAANSLVFTLVNGVLLRDLPFANPERLVAITSRDVVNDRTANVSYLDLRDLQASSRAVTAVGGYEQTSMSVADNTVPAERLTGAYVSANMFSLIGQRPRLGRDFTLDDDRDGAERVVVLGHALWQRRYGGRTDVVGRSIRVDGVASTVVGVMPEGFAFPEVAEIWQPLVQLPAARRERRDRRSIDVLARLAPGVTIAQADAAFDTTMAGLARAHAETNTGVELTVFPYREAFVGRRAIEVFSALMGAVGFLLLIACANVANLSLARASGRAREMSIRASMGAGRGRIVRQLLVEAAVLTALAGAGGLAAGAAGVQLFASAFSRVGTPYWLRFPLDASVFGFVATACLGTALLFGLMPALYASRTNLGDLLNEAGRASTGSVRTRCWTGAMVVVQVALALVLVTSGGLLLRSAHAHSQRDSGITTAGLVTMRLELPDSRYRTEEQRAAFYRQLDDRLAAMPGMRAAIATPVPRMGGPERTLSIEGQRAPEGRRPPRVTTVAVGQRYFEVLGVMPFQGRTFTELDHGRAAVVVVNQRFASQYFPDSGALGQRIELGPDGPVIGPTGWLTIVGIVPNVRQNDEEEAAFDPVAYLPYTSGPLPNAMVLVRSELDMAAVAGSIRSAVQRLDADLPVFQIATLDDLVAQEGWPLRLFGAMFGAFAVSALTLAALGLYAVTAYAAAQRTREIGVRVALGARPVNVWWTVSRRTAIQVAVGLALGMAGALASGKLLQSILAGVSGRDPATLIAVPALLIVVALAACLIPARRAMRLNPVEALRSE
jgi:putative ABC transport system permease protein